ncbi:TPA: hypothetical protein ACH3X2_000616 [Trebouxia sp. C0005]
METTPVDDPRASYVNEPGLYRLIARSNIEKAEQFQDWVCEKVLPSIRKTGSYSVQQGTLTATHDIDWCSKRLEGKELMKLKNASLQQLISGAFGQTGRRLYGIAGNLINQAVLGFRETTKQFKQLQQQQVPAQISIPDLPDMQGQGARCYAETCFQTFVTDNLQRDLPQTELIQEFEGLKVNMRQGFVLTGMDDLQTKMLAIDEAQKRKKEQSSQARKRQKLLQAEQPRAIEYAV